MARLDEDRENRVFLAEQAVTCVLNGSVLPSRSKYRLTGIPSDVLGKANFLSAHPRGHQKGNSDAAAKMAHPDSLPGVSRCVETGGPRDSPDRRGMGFGDRLICRTEEKRRGFAGRSWRS